MNRLKNAFWIIFFLSLTNYALMALWSLSNLQTMSGGDPIFDLRFSGYSLEQAKTLLTALGDEGISFYLNIQHKLDFTYPVLLALTLALAIVLLAPPKWGRWRFALALIALPGAVFDYFENAAVAKLLELGAQNLTLQSVASASRFTTLKAGFDGAALGMLLILLVLWAWQWNSARSRHTS